MIHGLDMQILQRIVDALELIWCTSGYRKVGIIRDRCQTILDPHWTFARGSIWFMQH
jgi:hypothetical protein